MFCTQCEPEGFRKFVRDIRRVPKMMKEKNVKHSIRDLRAAEKNLDSCLIAWNEHKKHISKHFNVNVGSAANEIYRGFLKK